MKIFKKAFKKKKKIFKKIFNKKKKKALASWECYGGFDIWEGTCCTSGHFWGCETKEEAFPALLGVLNNFRKEKNWTEEEYQKHLKSNLKDNQMEKMYEEFKKEVRKKKLDKINEKK